MTQLHNHTSHSPHPGDLIFVSINELNAYGDDASRNWSAFLSVHYNLLLVLLDRFIPFGLLQPLWILAQGVQARGRRRACRRRGATGAWGLTPAPPLPRAPSFPGAPSVRCRRNLTLTPPLPPPPPHPPHTYAPNPPGLNDHDYGICICGWTCSSLVNFSFGFHTS